MAKPAARASDLVRSCIDLGLRLRQAMAAALEPLGVTPEQQEVLRQLVAGHCSPGQLVVATARDKTTLSRIIARTIGLGLVERDGDARDRRRHVLRATERGFEVHDQAERAVVREAEALLKALSPRQRRRLDKAVRKLRGARSAQGGQERRRRAR